MLTTSHKQELKKRIEAKRKRLEAKLAEARASSSKQSRETIEKLEAKLTQLESHLIKGWDDMTEAVAAKLNTWLDDSDKGSSA